MRIPPPPVRTPPRVREGGPVPTASRLFPLLGILLLAGCEIGEITLAEPEPLTVVEAWAQAGEAGDQVRVYLHPASGGSGGDPGRARVRVRADGGGWTVIPPRPLPECLVEAQAESAPGACHALEGSGVPGFRPGARLDLEVVLPDGSGLLTGSTTLPGEFRIALPGLQWNDRCLVRPGLPLTVEWTPSAGSWAYLAETEIAGLREALEPRGIVVDSDPLRLLGLSISRGDTTIVFPGEFGIFDRGSLDRGLALALQEGLPPGASAIVMVAAADRNYVNWVRGGSFNPSGEVRVPSVRGPGGTGVFGSQVLRSFRLEAGEPRPGFPACR